MLTEQQEAVILKVQKLLNLAERAGSDEEAQNAVMRAREMLSKYNLTLDQVKSFKEEECLEDAFILKRRFIPSYMRHLSSAMGSMFSCRIINTLHDGGNINRQRISFIGVGIDSKLACQTFYFLYEHMNRKCREKRLKGRDATDYKYGFAIVVARRCREMDKKLKDIPQESALVPLKDAVINSYVHRVYPNLTFSRQRTRDYSAAMGDGMADGEKVNLGRPIEKGADRVGISS